MSDHPDLSPSHGARQLQDWSLNVLKRMAAAVLVSGSVSITSHLFCMHAILLVHGGFRPLLGSQAERVRISRFSCFKAWRSCSDSWGQHCKFHQQSFGIWDFTHNDQVQPTMWPTSLPNWPVWSSSWASCGRRCRICYRRRCAPCVVPPDCWRNAPPKAPFGTPKCRRVRLCWEMVCTFKITVFKQLYFIVA